MFLFLSEKLVSLKSQFLSTTQVLTSMQVATVKQKAIISGCEVQVQPNPPEIQVQVMLPLLCHWVFMSRFGRQKMPYIQEALLSAQTLAQQLPWPVVALGGWILSWMIAYCVLWEHATAQDREGTTLPGVSPGSSILLVTAHPDDEAMFFVPTIKALSKRYTWHLVCLSTGNAEGLGNTRSLELYDSCTNVLGMQLPNIHVVNDPELPDGMRVYWPPDQVARHIGKYVNHRAEAQDPIRAIISFDSSGVSKHPNHISTHFGVRQYCADSESPPAVYCLESISVPRKFSGIYEYFLKKSITGNSRALILVQPSILLVYRAMKAHMSQFVWFRRLFLAFSSYTFVNCIKRDNT
eukprot:gb/GECG01016090.1/.p1 GENE.gb/GECG01016090.1/~~gb/GECG01016090.1/.p1  ORF type:complete len:351 (+),score=15.33 gb/GECG01016090.1/:1-1053(+)